MNGSTKTVWRKQLYQCASILMRARPMARSHSEEHRYVFVWRLQFIMVWADKELKPIGTTSAICHCHNLVSMCSVPPPHLRSTTNHMARATPSRKSHLHQCASRSTRTHPSCKVSPRRPNLEKGWARQTEATTLDQICYRSPAASTSCLPQPC